MNTPIKNKELLKDLGTSVLIYLSQTPKGYCCLGYGNDEDGCPLLVDVYDLKSTDLWATDDLGRFRSGWVGADDTRLYFITVERMKKLVNDLLNPKVELEPGQIWKNENGEIFTIGLLNFGNKAGGKWWCVQYDDKYGDYPADDMFISVFGTHERVVQYLENFKATLH